MSETRSVTSKANQMLRAIRAPDALPAATRQFSGAVSLELAPGDGMYTGNDAHYYECGASALNVILSALQLAQVPAPASILDFGAGAGRVTRWLRAAFPGATIGACDLRTEDLDFCRTQFDAETWNSGIDIEALNAPGTYDLVWVGSVLTHLSAENAERLTHKLLSWTNPGGILVMSTIGRIARTRKDNGGDDYIHPEAWDAIKKDYADLGFGYADYLGQVGYGLSLTKLSWSGNLAESLSTARLILLAEGVWDTLHDVVAIQNRPASDLSSGAATVGRNASALRNAATASQLAAELIGREREVSALRAQVSALESSRSWQLTKPLRAAMRIFRR